MPNRKKKDRKCSHHTSSSHWQNFHFSGKLIVCSVIFGFMLVLIGGIVYAIGMDRDDDTKSDDYEDLQKKPPMVIVGPVMMGIGGFIVLVGVGMCLVETNVCRRRNVENSPLIDGESVPKDSEAAGIESDPSEIPSSSRRHRNGNRKKSPSPRRSKLPTKKPHFTKDRNQESESPRSPSSAPINVGGNVSKSFLSASDKFLTPPSSFVGEMQPNSRDAENQTSSSLMQSFALSGNSWTASTEFQTPTASSMEDSMSLESSKLSDGMQYKLDPNASIMNSHKYLTPKNSNVEMTISVEINAPENLIFNDPLEQECSDVSNEAEIQNKEIKQPLESPSDAPVTVSAKEIAELQVENIESKCNSTSSTIKELEPLSQGNSEGNIEPQIGVVKKSSITCEDATEKEISTKHSNEGIPFDSLLKQGTEQNPTTQELLKDQKCELPNTDIQAVREDNQSINETVLKEDSNTSPSQIVGINDKQEDGDESQDKDSESKSLKSAEKITEIESTNDISEPSNTGSLNSDDT